MKNSERIKEKNFYYKMGVTCGKTLYYTYKFDNFEKMMQEANNINNKYKSDMMYCAFVIQAFKDNSYDFEKSCFYQSKLSVNNIESQIENVAQNILKDFEETVK